jgi:tocopherol cyclase
MASDFCPVIYLNWGVFAAGTCRLRIWRLTASGIRKGEAIVDALSSSAALEVGGGPWWGNWAQEANMNIAVAAAVRAPVASAIGHLESAMPFEVPSLLKPPGY